MYSSTKLGLIAFVFLLIGCSQDNPSTKTKAFYNIDSLITQQVLSLKGHELSKSVDVNNKKEQATFVPDSAQWRNELDIFRQLDEVNKASFRDAYIVSDSRDTNSNLTVREIKATRPVPVTLLRLYFLNTPSNLKKIEATWTEENTLYVNDRRLIMELDHIVHRYHIEGFQKMVMNDSVRFSIEGEVKIK